jgi:hypothetical protein
MHMRDACAELSAAVLGLYTEEEKEIEPEVHLDSTLLQRDREGGWGLGGADLGFEVCMTRFLTESFCSHQAAGSNGKVVISEYKIAQKLFFFLLCASKSMASKCRT